MNIIITGASMGLGKAIAERFATGSHQLFLCSRNLETLAATAASIQSKFPHTRLHYKATDLSVKEQVHAFADWCLQHGTPDILINNAGQFIPGSVHNEAEGVLEEQLQTNLFSAYYLTRAILPVMIQKKAGHIFNMCSIASINAYANGGSYSISKFALYGFNKNLREEMKPYGIKVTAVLPGAAFTNSWADSGINPKRIMEAKDIAEMVFAAANLSPQACVEEIILRPQLGDL
jgi:short-subunit dehydrogenase